MALNRIPYVTLILLALNVIFYFVGTAAEAPYRAFVQTKEREMVGYFTQHPNLELPPETFEKISIGGQTAIGMARSQKLKVGETLAVVDEKLTLMEHFLESDDPSEPQKQDDPKTMQAIIDAERKRRQAELDGLIQEFEASLERSFYKDFGFIPAQGNLKTMFTSMFLHQSFFQLAINMLLLFGLGYVIEGAWHSLVFPLFYLFGGLFATLAYKLSAPHSAIPLLGIAGALAALAGALAVRSYNSEEAAASLVKGCGVLVVVFGILFGLRFATGNEAVGDIIGGVLFGALVAGVFRFTHFERNVLLPEEERKIERAHRHLARGTAFLRDGNLNDAIEALKQATDAEPANHVIARELCKAYAQKGSHNPAVRKFKQVIAYQMKHDALEDAVDDYVELSELLPNVVFDVAQHLQLAAAIEERALRIQRERQHSEENDKIARRFFTKAAAAYRDFVSYRQQTSKTLDLPEAIEALQHYADICGEHLSLPEEAQQAYRTLLGLSHVSPEQKKIVQSKIQQVAQALSTPASKSITSEHADESPQPARSPRPNVPLQQRLKLVRERDDSAKHPLTSVAPIKAKQVTSVSGGMELGRGSDSSICFGDIYAMFIAQLPEEQDELKARKHGTSSVSTILVADIFIGGQPRPYRVRSSQIAYPQFLSNVQQNSVKNFHQFLLRTLQQIEAVYIDQETFDFLKTGKIPQYPGQDAVEKHERNLWQQLVGLVRFHCEHCWEIYWVDRSKIPESGATTKCAKCGSAISVKRNG